MVIKYFEKDLNSVDEYFKKRNFKNIGMWIALASGLELYLELILIRLHTSYFQIFGYFKNISLIACFLGLGIGYALGLKKKSWLFLVLPILALQIIIMHVMRLVTGAFFLQNPVSEQLTMGLEQSDKLIELVTVYGFIIFIFLLSALMFIPLGQLTAKFMLREKKLRAYSWNLIGSVLGIALFTLLSFLWTPPAIWISIAAVGLLVFTYHHKRAFFITAITTLLLLAFIMLPVRFDKTFIYSPYQVLSINYERNEPAVIKVSNVYFQKMLDIY